jgi:hypothetical protein
LKKWESTYSKKNIFWKQPKRPCTALLGATKSTTIERRCTHPEWLWLYHSVVVLFRFVIVRIIGQRWKNIDPDRLSRFSELAAEDTERYKSEMTSYNARQESKMRNELKPPPVSYQGLGMGAPGPMAGYGGYSDFSGYGMGMGGYGMPESAANMSYGAAYGQPMEPPPGSYGGGGYSMGGMMGGGYQGGMMAYDPYGQPIDGSVPPGPPGPYSTYPPHGGWGQG